MKMPALLSFLFVTAALTFAGCASQETKQVNYGYGVEMEEDSTADQAKVLK